MLSKSALNESTCSRFLRGLSHEAASTHRKALVGWSWGRLATHLQHRHVVAPWFHLPKSWFGPWQAGHRALLVAKEVFRRTLMAWARLVSAASRDQAERASWVIQAWARLASMRPGGPKS